MAKEQNVMQKGMGMVTLRIERAKESERRRYQPHTPHHIRLSFTIFFHYIFFVLFSPCGRLLFFYFLPSFPSLWALALGKRKRQEKKIRRNHQEVIALIINSGSTIGKNYNSHNIFLFHLTFYPPPPLLALARPGLSRRPQGKGMAARQAQAPKGK